MEPITTIGFVALSSYVLGDRGVLRTVGDIFRAANTVTNTVLGGVAKATEVTEGLIQATVAKATQPQDGGTDNEALKAKLVEIHVQALADGDTERAQAVEKLLAEL